MKHVLNDVPNIVQCPGNGQGRQPSQHNTHHESDIFRFHQTGTYWTLTTCLASQGWNFMSAKTPTEWSSITVSPQWCGILALILAVKFHEVSHGSHHSHHSHRLIRAMLQAPLTALPTASWPSRPRQGCGEWESFRRPTSQSDHFRIFITFVQIFWIFWIFWFFFSDFHNFFHISSKSLIVSALLLVKIW
jgi:hypothetical protein